MTGSSGRVLGVVGLCIFVLCVSAGSALGDGPGGLPGIPPGVTPGSHALPAGGGAGVTQTGSGGGAGGSTGSATTPPPKTSTVVTPPPKRTTVPSKPAKKIKLTKRCSYSRKYHRGTRTCTYRRGHTLVRKCVKKPRHRETCRTFHTSRAALVRRAPVAKIAGTRINSGFAAQPSASVVRIYWNCSNPSDGTSCSRCSGSMLANGIVLTAGHCVYSNYPDGYVADKTGFVGYYNSRTYFVVPGNTWSSGQPTAPYGTWGVKNMWTTSDYARGLLGGDWGIIELSPNAQGRYPGDVGIGAFTATWNQPTIDDLYSIGYATAGVFGQPQYDLGNWQYFCETQWAPTTDSESGVPSFGNYYGLVVQPCEETGGASGGPVFTDVNGGWTIVGVNNRGPAPNAQGVGIYMLSFYFNDAFGTFWRDVIGQVNAGA